MVLFEKAEGMSQNTRGFLIEVRENWGADLGWGSTMSKVEDLHLCHGADRPRQAESGIPLIFPLTARNEKRTSITSAMCNKHIVLLK